MRKERLRRVMNGNGVQAPEDIVGVCRVGKGMVMLNLGRGNGGERQGILRSCI